MPEQIKWETILGSIAPNASLSRKVKNIQIDAPQNLNGGDRKWKDS